MLGDMCDLPVFDLDRERETVRDHVAPVLIKDEVAERAIERNTA